MSKIGKINISIPEKVKVAINGSNLNIEGPLGKTSLNLDLDTFDLKIKDGKSVLIKPKSINPFNEFLLFIRIFKIYKKYNPKIACHFTIKPNIYGSIICRLLKIKSIMHRHLINFASL